MNATALLARPTNEAAPLLEIELPLGEPQPLSGRAMPMHAAHVGANRANTRLPAIMTSEVYVNDVDMRLRLIIEAIRKNGIAMRLGAKRCYVVTTELAAS